MQRRLRRPSVCLFACFLGALAISACDSSSSSESTDAQAKPEGGEPESEKPAKPESGGDEGGPGDADGPATEEPSPSDAQPGASPSPPEDGERPPLEDILPNYFTFGYSSFSKTREWPAQVAGSHGIKWNFLYWYQLVIADETVLPTRLKEADKAGVIPILTHYQLLDRSMNARKARGEEAKKDGEKEWDIVLEGVEDPELMRGYFDDIESLMKVAADHTGPIIFQVEPDSTTWMRQYHTGETWNADNGVIAVASSGHPDLAELPNTIAGYAQALVKLRDLHAPDNVYIGWCDFDNEDGFNPDRSVSFLNSLGTEFDVLFTHHVVKYDTRDEGWWDAYSQVKQDRFLKWVKTITDATGLKYIHWQTVVGSADYGLMPDYPKEERISDLVAAGSVATLFDLFTLDGPPHSQPWHGYASSPPEDHAGYNSLDKLAERLGAYYESPIPLRSP